MKKLVISAAVMFSLVAGVASAQSYYPTSTYISGSTYSSGGCVSITQTLAIGSRGGQVLALQQFLVSQNYPGGGSWMETGYFGTATAAAVRDFQQAQGLPITGVVDVNTQLAIDRVSCGGSAITYPGYPVAPSYPTLPTYPTTPVYPTYPTYPSYPGYGTPTITSLSQNTGTPGNSVTIFGQGFDPSNNTVNFGGTVLQGIPSYNGTSLSFTVPYTNVSYASNQSIQLSVTDSRGTSNSETFTLNPSISPIGCNTYTYGTNCGCVNTFAYSTGCNQCGYNYNSTYPYTSNNCVNQNSLSITYVNPQSGGVGTAVTVYGTGFTTSGNTIHFGNGIVTGLGSADGQSLSFIVPSQLTGFGSQPIVLGTYEISATNGNGATSNQVPFTITSTNSTTGNPTITSVTGPTTLSTGSAGTWNVVVNNPNSNYATVSVAWGDTGNGFVDQAAPQTVYNGSQTLTFSHAYNTAGTYSIQFTVANQSGQSNIYSATVVVTGGSTGYYGVPSISYISPNSAYVGQQVTIYGSNFQGSNMVINFGSGAIQNVSSNGSSITFTVPSSVGPNCVSGQACPQYLQQITPGTYNVSVMDQYGTSNTISFTVL